MKVMLDNFPIPPLTVIELSDSPTSIEINDTLSKFKNYPTVDNIGFASIVLVKNSVIPNIVKVYYENGFESQRNDGGFDLDVILEDDTNPITIATTDPEWEYIRFVLAYDENEPVIDTTLLSGNGETQVVVHKLYFLYYYILYLL